MNNLAINASFVLSITVLCQMCNRQSITQNDLIKIAVLHPRGLFSFHSIDNLDERKLYKYFVYFIKMATSTALALWCNCNVYRSEH